MPGHPRSIFKGDSSDLDPFLCPKCDRILNDPVTLHNCNCRVCAACADSAIDHRAGAAWCQQCGEKLEQRSTKYYSHDQSTQIRINRLTATCQVCNWEGSFGEYQQLIYYECDPKLSRVYPFQSLASPLHSPTLSLEPMNTQCSFCNMMIPSHEVDSHLLQCPLQERLCSVLSVITDEVLPTAREAIKSKDEEIALLHRQVTKLEKMIELLNAKIEEQGFQLSMIENISYDGSMIWKISQFSQRKANAENGKYTSIFSLPFYSDRYGYKMCLRLYIMGDGIGKGTHLSLFFVVLRGEFDNILQWPFTHKVTFKLINQAGGRDIVDTLKSDPMNKSFGKPTSDMNIASGCPQFVSHTELEMGGFIMDDTIFIKCSIYTSTSS